MEATEQIAQDIEGRLGEIRSEVERLEAARVALRPSETTNGRRRGRPPKNAPKADD